MLTKTRSRSLSLNRKPVWDAFCWLECHYEEDNGLPGFFLSGSYTYDMREDAEHDYINTVEQASKCNNEAFNDWAINIKENKYSPLRLSSTKDYWKILVTDEIKELKRNKLYDSLVSKANPSQTVLPKRQKHFHISKDLMYFDDINESVGMIIGNSARNINVVDRKTNYFKTLGMNQIIDISDMSEGSHLDLFSILQQQKIFKKLSSAEIEKSSNDNTLDFENIIDKFRNVQDEKIFLSKVIKEITDTRDVDEKTQKIYLKILDTMLNEEYLFDSSEQNSENDFLVKLHGPIMESEFRGTGIRLRWGDTQPKECKENEFNCKIDLRITTNTARHIDLSAVEYAKEPGTSKYYNDKLKLVLSAFIHLRKYMPSKISNADISMVPFMLVEGLEGESSILFLVDNDWLVIQKLGDVNVPNNVDSIKNGAIMTYINGLDLFKDHCLNVKIKAFANKKMKNITQAKQQEYIVLKKPIWKSRFVDKDEE